MTNIPVLVKVKIHESEDTIIIVGTRRPNQGYGEYDTRQYQYSITIFHESEGKAEYLLNYVIFEEEVELLGSDMKIKVVDDIGFKLIAGNYTLKLYKHHRAGGDSEWYKKYYDTDVANVIDNMMAELRFTSENKDSFCEALKWAIRYPFDGHLYYELPTQAHGEVTL